MAHALVDLAGGEAALTALAHDFSHMLDACAAQSLPAAFVDGLRT